MPANPRYSNDTEGLKVETPWGPAQTATKIAEGITYYSTAGHGGIKLSPERLRKVPQPWQDYAARWSHGWGPSWFEEDIAICLVYLAFPDVFSQPIRELAVSTALRHLGEAWNYPLAD